MAKNAFTLIELLIVIAIIAILAGIIVATLGNPSTQAEDATRMNDLDSIADAAQQYQIDNGSYPDNIAALVSGGYLAKTPVDPDGVTAYNYAHCTVGSKPRVVVAAVLQDEGNIGVGSKAAGDGGDITCADESCVEDPVGGNFCTSDVVGDGVDDVIECADAAAASENVYCVSR